MYGAQKNFKFASVVFPLLHEGEGQEVFSCLSLPPKVLLRLSAFTDIVKTSFFFMPGLNCESVSIAGMSISVVQV